MNEWQTRLKLLLDLFVEDGLLHAPMIVPIWLEVAERPMFFDRIELTYRPEDRGVLCELCRTGNNWIGMGSWWGLAFYRALRAYLAWAEKQEE